MTAGIRVFNTSGHLLIDDRFKGLALKPVANAVAGDIHVKDASGREYVFGDVPALGAGVGMRVFSSVDHSVVFDSRNKYIRVVDSFTANIGAAPATRTYTAGRAYAVGAVGYAMRVVTTQANIKPVAASVDCDITLPGISVSGAQVTIGSLTSSDLWGVPAGTPAGAVVIDRRPWTAVVVDVTGY